ncbi:MAG: hypothetical protein WC485_00010 [Opitutaceae bacterium]
MRTTTLTVAIVLVLLASAGQLHGQNTSDTIKSYLDFRRSNFQHDRRVVEAGETGAELLGRDERCGKKEFAGTLRGKIPKDYKIGDWGCYHSSLRVISAVSSTSCIVMPTNRTHGGPFLVRGLDMSKMVDNVEFTLQHPFIILGTYRYSSASGASRTILAFDCGSKFNEFIAEKTKRDRQLADEKEKADAEERARLDEARWHTWTIAKSGERIDGKFSKVVSGVVYVTTRSGEKTTLQLDELSEGDHVWIKDRCWKKPSGNSSTTK